MKNFYANLRTDEIERRKIVEDRRNGGFTGSIILDNGGQLDNSEHSQFKCRARLLRHLLLRALLYFLGHEISIALSSSSFALGRILFLYSHGFNVTPGELSSLS